MTDSQSGIVPWSRRRRFRALRIVGGSLVVLLVLLGAALLWLAHDRDLVKAFVENAVTAISGHSLSIEGEFEYRLGSTISLDAGKIRWRTSTSYDSRPLLEIERLSGALDLWSLIFRPIRITDVQVEQGTLWLEWDHTDAFNWARSPPMKSDGEPPAARAPLPLIIERGSLRNLAIRLHHPALTDQLEVLVTEAQHQRDAANRLVLAGEARLEDRTLVLNGRIGPVPELAVGGPVDFDLSVVGPLASLTARGSAASVAQLRDLQLAARLQAPSAVDLSQRLRLSLDTEGAVDLEAQIDARDERLQVFGGGSFGEFEIDARFRAESLDSLAGLEAYVRSKGPSANALGAVTGRPGLPDDPYEFEASVKRTAQGLELRRLYLETGTLSVEASGIARSLAELRDIDLRLSAQGSDVGVLAALIGRDAPAAQAFRLGATVTGHGRDRDDEVDVQMVVGDATARLTGWLSEAADLAGSRLKIEFVTPRADQLGALLGVLALPQTKLEIAGRIDVAPQQVSFHQLQAALGDAEFSGIGRLGRGPGPLVGEFEGHARGPDLAALLSPALPPTLRPFVPRSDFTATAALRLAPSGLQITAARAESAGNSLAFEGRVDTSTPGMHLAGDLSVKGDDFAGLFDDAFKVPGPAIGAFSLQSHVRLAPGALRFEALQLATPQAQIEGGLSFTGEDPSSVEFDLTGVGSDLSALLPGNAFYRPADVPFKLAARGKGNARAISVMQLEATLDATRLAFSGDVELQPQLAMKGFRLEGSGPRLSDLGRFGDLRFTDEPFRVIAVLAGSAHEQHIDNLEFESGDNDLSGRISIKGDARPVIEIELGSKRLALDELRLGTTQAGAPPSPKQSEDRLFTDEPLPFELLDRFDGKIRVEVASLFSHQRAWRDVAVDAVIEEGALEIRQARADAARGKVQLRASIKPTATGRHVTAQMTAADAMLASAEMTAEELDRLPRHAIEARLSATGNTPHELASSLNGFVWIIGGQGEGPRAKFSLLFGDFLTELGAAVVQAESEKTTARVDCDGIYLEIDDGKVKTAPAIVLQTKKVVVFAVGTVDLATEKIDFLFETTPLRGVGISLGDLINPFTKLSGTLRRPRISLSPEGTLLEGGAAVATSGLSIVIKSLWKRWFGSRQICEKVANKALELRSERDPANVPDLTRMIAGTGAATDAEPAAPETATERTRPRTNLEEVYD